jgi:hypothetical protein
MPRAFTFAIGAIGLAMSPTEHFARNFLLVSRSLAADRT